MNLTQEIKNKLSIAEVVSDYVQLKRYGKNYKGLCPFHEDTHPSLVVNEETGLVWCFACSNGGDMFNFIQMIEGCSFIESLNILGKKSGIDVKKYIPITEKDKKIKNVIETLDCACNKFIQDLKTNEHAKLYVESRKIPQDILSLYRVGYADKNERSMSQFLLDSGFEEDVIVESGIAIKTSDGIVDKFNDRIMFPFESYSGSIVGYIGRTLCDENPKYLNTSNGETFKKGELLYGLTHARRSAAQRKEFYVVEGQFDVLGCRSADIKNVVASSGTAFSSIQAMQIKKYANTVNFAYDSDKAGIEATIRSIEIASSCGLICNVIQLPNGKDPDEIMIDGTIDDIFTNKIDAVDFVFSQSLKTNNINTANGKQNIIDDAFKFISKISSTIYRDHCIKRLSEISGIQKHILEGDYSKEYKQMKNAETYKEKIGFDAIEIFVGTIISFPKLMDISKKHLLEALLPESVSRDIYMLIKNNNLYSKKKILEMVEQYIEGHHDKWNLISVYTTNLYEKLSDKMLEVEFVKIIKNINKKMFKIKYDYLKNTKAPTKEITDLLTLSKNI